jgi:hypothetical protein
MLRLVLPLAAASTLLGACASSGTGVFGARGKDWPGYAAAIYAMPAAERQALQTEAANHYAERGGADAAIRLAILTATPDASLQDLGAALDLLDQAETGLGGGAGDAESRGFIAFLRPLLLTLQAQRSALAAESLARQSVEEQLEALKALEESLNANDGNR